MKGELFNSVMGRKPKKNIFDLSHSKMLSMNMGQLIPIMCEDAVPGDVWRCNTETLVRLAPLAAPMMHRVNVIVESFFVPYRLIWTNFEKFITGGEDGTDATVHPYIVYDAEQNNSVGTLYDYLGLGILGANPTNQLRINALPARAYQLIYKEFYRDQDLEDAQTQYKTDGLQSYNSAGLGLRKRCWEKDYFTSARPWTQKGSEIQLPLGASTEVTLDTSWDQRVVNSSGTAQLNSALGSDDTEGYLSDNNNSDANAWIDPNGSLLVENLTGPTINELRQAVRIQEWLERNARSGSRYVESLLSHFGVKSKDERLDRPEYLGGGKTPIVISEVLQTSEEGSTPQGNMAGHGISVGKSNSFTKYIDEHGIIMTIMSVMPRTAYNNSTRRWLFRADKFDYVWPSFANLGEQEVYTMEVDQGFDVDLENKEVFGYQSRYAEMKYIPDSVHGQFKSTLLEWHMGRSFATKPSLNSTFVISDPTHNVFADTNTANHKLWCQVYNNVKAVRPLPKFGTPIL